MNKNILIIAAIILVLGGGFLLLRKGSPPTLETTDVPRNPEGVINQEVESSNYKLYSKTVIIDSEGQIASTTTGPLTKEELRSKLIAARK